MPADLRAALEPLANSLIDGEYCAGLVVALIAPSGPPQILAWGETVRDNGKAPDGNTVFEIGSVSKVFTSLALAALVIDHQVTLDTPVAALLPDTRLPAGERAITLLDLATHTSGLPPMVDNLDPADPANPYAGYTSEQLFAFLGAARLEREPGEHYEYSNLGSALLGQALARRAGTDWPGLIDAQIARPLAMTSTMVALTDDTSARFAQGYGADGEPTKSWDLPTFAGAGALRSTAADMAAFVMAELAATRDPTSRMASAMALTQKPQRDLGPGSPGRIGLGWHIRSDGTVWHNGQTGGYHGYVAFQPSQQIGVVVLANGATGHVDALGSDALAALAGQPVPGKLDLPPPDHAVDETTLERYVGTYPLDPAFAITVSRIGTKLCIQATGQPRIRLHATSQRDFAAHAVSASVTFEVESTGKVTGLVLHQGGKAHRAPRQ